MSQPVVPNGTGTVVSTDPVAPQNTPEPESQNDQRLSYEQMETELKKVRAEAASRRVTNRELEENAKKWREYEESQKSELQKLQDAVADRDKRIAEKELEVTRTKIAKEYNVVDDDLDLLVGDEENMKRLAERLGNKKSETRPLDLLAGNRGNPVGSADKKDSGSFMDNLIRGNR